MSIPADLHARLVAAGLLGLGPEPRPLPELSLERLPADASSSVRAILEDREEAAASYAPRTPHEGN